MKTARLLAVLTALSVAVSVWSKSAAEQWADSLMAHMSMQEKVAQLFCPRLDVRDNHAGREAIRRMVQQEHVGGILLGKGNIVEYANLNNYAQSLAEIPLMITLDGEWGPAMRLTDAVRFPYNIALGAIQNSQLMYDYGLEVARECRELGITVDFAPVLDVNSNPDNPVIGFRSLGEDPHRVSELGVAFARGLEAGGVLSVAKHFPGHGDTSVDSHKALPTVTHSRHTLDNVDLLPFKSYISAGLGGIMVGHLKVPALDKSGTPASLSHKISTDLLQKELKFNGLVFTDALAMKGAVSGHKNNCVAALQAGADVLLGSGAPSSDIDAVMKAVEKGKISKETINERCRKLLVYKYKLGLKSYTPVNIKGLMERVNSPTAYALVEKLANASMTLLNNKQHVLPIDSLSRKEIAVACVGAELNCEFVRMCEKYAPVIPLPTGDHGLTRTGMSRMEDADIVIMGIFGSPAATTNLLKQLKGKKVVTVFFDNPFKMAKYHELGAEPTLLLAYDKSPQFQRAAAMALFGGINVNGRCPVNIKGIAAVGQGIDLNKNRLGYQALPGNGLAPRLNFIVDSICSKAIKAGAMSGCQVVVAKDGNIVLDKSFGRIDFDETSPKVTGTTLFDLASMTKAVATTPAIMLAVDEGLINLNAPIARYVPELENTDKQDITVTELLTHQSGMPPVVNVRKIMTDTASYSPPLNSKVTDATLRTDILSKKSDDEFYLPVAEDIWISDMGVDTLMQKIYDAPLGKKNYVYSCLNFCLLKTAQENVTGVDMDQWIDTRVFAPLGAWHTGFLPLTLFEPEMIAYTENDKIFRHQHLHGYVHDEIAAFSGGVQGNAGLYGTAGDMAKFGQMLLNNGTYGGERIISDATVKEFTGTITAAQRALGFDLLRRNKSLAPSNYTGNAYGHTGYTGTCFWIDPQQQLVIVVLTNRVNPSRDNAAFARLNPRGAIISAVYESLNQ